MTLPHAYCPHAMCLALGSAMGCTPGSKEDKGMPAGSFNIPRRKTYRSLFINQQLDSILKYSINE